MFAHVQDLNKVKNRENFTIRFKKSKVTKTISCKVVNAANTEEVYTLWDSTDDVMSHRNPMKSSEEWFYGVSYKGKHLKKTIFYLMPF